MELKTEIAIAIGWIGMTGVAMGEFCGGVLLKVRLKMEIFEEACAQGEETQEEENGGEATQGEAIVRVEWWKSQ